MLTLKEITKSYGEGENEVKALKGISISFRRCEFVSILGQSGCGKTTLLNIIGGLDRATSGELCLNGKSTAGFNDNDWDDYRNSKIGFVFQNYNLIPHLNVLTNVELALTISGVKAPERTERAKKALEKVGLLEKWNKRPNQLSGGQMQRVAIARAIVNEPEILLADEPTGAIDSDTSLQIMDILKEISKTRLVVMVTHNAELAEKYSTRVVRFLDGEIIDDTNPYNEEIDEQNDTATEEKEAEISDEPCQSSEVEPIDQNVISEETAQSADNTAENAEFDIADEGQTATECENVVENIEISDNTKPKKEGKTRRKHKRGMTMSFFTAMKLSWKNLVNKKGRSLLTAIAGSIGIISIALILAVNNGFNNYISDFERKSMSKYPITVSSGDDSVVSAFEEFLGGDQLDGDSLNIGSVIDVLTTEDNIRDKYSDDEIVYIYGKFCDLFETMVRKFSKTTDISEFKKHVESNFDYDLAKVKYDYSIDMTIYSKDVKEDKTTYTLVSPLSESPQMQSMIEMLGAGAEKIKIALDTFAFWDEIIADRETLDAQYEVLSGSMPSGMNEVVLVVDEYNQITDFDAVTLNQMTLSALITALDNRKMLDDYNQNFDEIVGREFYILPTSAGYVYNSETKLYDSVKEKGGVMLQNALETSGIPIKISGIIRPREGYSGCINGVIGYTSELGNFIIDDANKSAIAIEYDSVYQKYCDALKVVSELAKKKQENSEYVPNMQEMQASSVVATGMKNLVTGEKLELQDYKNVIKDLNVREWDKPSYIYFYPNKVEDKDKIVKFIKDFNDEQREKEDKEAEEAKRRGEDEPTITHVIEYTDNLDSVIGELNVMVNTITYVLIGVACVSVIVTMFLIAIIMYISVQDRTREIGIMRAIGARKSDISNIFNVETMLLGLASGLIGALIAFILQFPCNLIFEKVLNMSTLLQMAWWHPLVLVAGAIVITVASGLIPAVIASKKEPVIALRTE